MLQYISASYERILMKFLEGWEGLVDPDPEIFYCPARLISLSLEHIFSYLFVAVRQNWCERRRMLVLLLVVNISLASVFYNLLYQ